MNDNALQKQAAERETRDWMPDTRISLLLNLAAGLLSIAALVPLLGWYGNWHNAQASFELTGWWMLIAIIVTLALTAMAMVIHEWIHAVVVGRTGGTPVYGVKLIGKVLPVFYVTSEGQLFTRAQFMTVALAPLAVLSIVFAVLIALVPFGGWLVFPAALHTGGCIGDIVMAWQAWREPPGTLVEDRIAGIRFYPPT